MKNKEQDKRFVNMRAPNRIWALPAIHGNIEKLTWLHDELLEHIQPGDRLVYLGNYTGYGEQSRECIDELLTFRRLLLSQPGMMCHDIIYLRGTQEEMWQSLLQLPFAPNPTDVFIWMLGNGLSNTLYSYGLSPHDGVEACSSGVMALTKWTNHIRKTIRSNPGHDMFGIQLARAAYTSIQSEAPLLFVHSGIDTSKPLEEQSDSFWWSGSDFETIDSEYRPFKKVIRGCDPAHGGIKLNCVTATIDSGCGFGGSLVAAGFDNQGQIFEMLEA